MDTVLTGALVLLAAVVATAGAVLVVLRIGGRSASDDGAVTDMGWGTAPSAVADAVADAVTESATDSVTDRAPVLLMVPLRREAGRERDVQAFLQDAAAMQARVEQALTPDQARVIETAQRVRARRGPEGKAEPADE